MKPKKLHILKIGGQVINDAEKLSWVLERFANWPEPKILVHGGGRKASELLVNLGITPIMREGRRVTDAQTLDVVVMTYAGLLNKKVVAQLQAYDCQAIGLSGADANVILAHQRPAQPIDYGFAGDIDEVNVSALQQLLQANLTPVFCAITHNQQGQLLNTNADTIAASLATALAGEYEVNLRYCFEKPGVLTDPDDDQSVMPSLSKTTFKQAQAAGTIKDGMIPKLDNAFSVLAAGAKAVWIGNAAGLLSLKAPKGTRLLADDAPQTVGSTPVALLQQLIQTPSFSREEHHTATAIEQYLTAKNFRSNRHLNNIWVRNAHWTDGKPTILLNSHHDTVKPAAGYTRDPFQATIEGDYLYGLGSNDAGASLVSLLATFEHYAPQKDLPFNLIFAATAEEEISGPNGIASLLPLLPKIDFGIIGEPTQMRMAIAERGLMVIDGIAHGKSGHAARQEGINAIDIALKDINWINSYQFEKVSPLLGPSKMTVTQVKAGKQHNVVPDRCEFVIDVRTNELTTNEGLFNWLQQQTASELKARSFRLSSSAISLNHPAIQRGLAMGLEYYGSPTLSDQALINGVPSLKMGVGKSKRSHTADEFVLLSEIEHGINTYIQFLQDLKL